MPSTSGQLTVGRLVRLLQTTLVLLMLQKSSWRTIRQTASASIGQIWMKTWHSKTSSIIGPEPLCIRYSWPTTNSMPPQWPDASASRKAFSPNTSPAQKNPHSNGCKKSSTASTKAARNSWKYKKKRPPEGGRLNSAFRRFYSAFSNSMG